MHCQLAGQIVSLRTVVSNNMKDVHVSIKKQRGASLLYVMLSGAAISGAVSYGMLTQENNDRAGNAAIAVTEHAENVYAGIMRCHYDLERWCTETELTTQGYVQTFTSPLGTAFVMEPIGDDVNLSIDVMSQDVAQRLRTSLPNASQAGSIVMTSLKRPSQSEMFSQRLVRIENTENPDHMQLETTINFDDNDLTNINELSIDTLDVVDLNFETLTTDNLSIVRGFNVGPYSIIDNGNTLDITADEVQFAGNKRVNGDIAGNNSDISGVATFEAKDGQITSITTNTLKSTTGNVGVMTGDNVSFNEANITSTTTRTIIGSTGIVDTLTTTTEDAKTYAAGSATITTANINSGTVTDVSGSSMNYGSGEIDNAAGNTVVYTNASITNVNTINSTIVSVSANNLTTNDLSGDNLEADTANGSSTSGNIANINNANIGQINTTTVDVETIDAQKYFGEALTVTNLDAVTVRDNDTKVSNSVVAQNGRVIGNTTTKTLTANNWTVDNTLTAGSVTGTTMNVSNTTESTTADANNINVTTANGNRFSASDDFYARDSSVNATNVLLDDLTGWLINCMDVTGYCLPQVPVVDLICRDCIRTAPRANFSGVATGTISECGLGCSYSWETSGTNLAFSFCQGGVVPEGGSATVTCDISASLAAQESASGTVRLVAVNSSDPSKTHSDSENINYFNSNTIDPFIDVLDGCFVDTRNLDTATGNGLCSGRVFVSNQSQNAQVVFSVGDNPGNQFTNPSDWSVIWSGDCTGSGNSCTANPSGPFGFMAYNSIANVTHIPTGTVESYSIVAQVCKSKSGGEPRC
jgi:hypothetical protein